MPLTPGQHAEDDDLDDRVMQRTPRASASALVMASLSRLGTSVWKMRLAKDSTIEATKGSRCEAMIGKMRRHHVRCVSREICARGPGYVGAHSAEGIGIRRLLRRARGRGREFGTEPS